MMKSRKVILSEMKKVINIHVLTFGTIIIFQIMYLLAYIYIQNPLTIFFMLTNLLIYLCIRNHVKPLYIVYLNLKLEEDFDIKPVVGKYVEQ